MNLNTAAAGDLTQLPRVGADKARRIARRRASRRGFRNWADFARTPGLSEADVEAIQRRAWIGPAPEGGWPAADRRRTSRAATGWGASAITARRRMRARRSATGRDVAMGRAGRRPAASSSGAGGPRSAAGDARSGRKRRGGERRGRR